MVERICEAGKYEQQQNSEGAMDDDSGEYKIK